MTTISGTGSSAWSTIGSARPARPPGGMDPGKMKEDLFAKVDADGSGTVDKTELQGMLDATVNKSGRTSTSTSTSTPKSADEVFASMDGNSDGSLSADELDAGMKSLLPQPADTVEFAQSRGTACAPQGPPPGPTPTSSTASTASSSGDIDPLDTNEDGTVSAQEKAAGELAEAMNDLLKAVDSNCDSSISNTERDTFMQMLSAAAGSSIQGTSAAGADGSSASSQGGSSGSRQDPFNLKQFADMVLQQYAQAAASTTQQALGSTLNLAA